MSTQPIQPFDQVAYLIRPHDLLVIGLDLENLQLIPATNRRRAVLTKITASRASYITLRLPPQSIGEARYSDNGASATILTPARSGGVSYLRFQLPADFASIPYQLEAILDAIHSATPQTLQSLTAPMTPNHLWDTLFPVTDFRLFSVLEMPYRLYLSPVADALWQFRSKPASDAQGFTELWHARLSGNDGDLTSSGSAGTRQAYAIWTPDELSQQSIAPRPVIADFNSQQTSIETALTAEQRKALIHLSSDTSGNNGIAPLPVDIDRMMISALGGWLDAKWEVPNPDAVLHSRFNLSAWHHEMMMGRDQYVKTVDEGYLYPTGHRAALIAITERKLAQVADAPPGADDLPGAIAASLRTRYFILVRTPDLGYQTNGMPFHQNLHVRPLVTPILSDQPETIKIINWQAAPPRPGNTPPPSTPPTPLTNAAAFWIQVPDPDNNNNAVDFRFHLAGTDWMGQVSDFTLPLLFVTANAANDSTILVQVLNKYNQVTSSRRTATLGGQPVAYAPPANGNAQDFTTTLHTDTFVFTSKMVAQSGAPFLPQMETASVHIATVKTLTGTDAPITITLHSTFQNGPDVSGAGSIINNADVFAEVTNPPSLAVDARKAGGLVSPNLAIEGISRVYGPVSNVKGLLNGSINIGNYFSNPGSAVPKVTLLGGITLDSIINTIQFDSPGTASTNIPTFTTTQDGNDVVTTFTYVVSQSQPVQPNPNPPPPTITTFQTSDLFTPGDQCTLSLTTTIRQSASGHTSTTTHGTLSDFTIHLLPNFSAVDVSFQSISFTSVDSSKPEVAIALNSIQFVGDLAFFAVLMRFVPMDGFSDPPSVDITADGINVGYTLAIPTIGIGAFTLEHLSLSAGFFLPLLGDGTTTLHLAFAERESPCILTVLIFGGGAYFGIDLNLNGLKSLEAALEFGVAAALDLGVASGSVSFMGGVYLKLDASGGTTKAVLTAFLSINGELSVLGLITISAQFYLGLTYDSGTDTLSGDATMEVEIKIAFFSKSVGISVHKDFKGHDPKFIDMLPPADWDEYLAAFAPVPTTN